MKEQVLILFFFWHFSFIWSNILLKKNNLGFTPCKTEQLLKGMELQEKEEKNKNTGKLLKEPKDKTVSIDSKLKAI